MMDKKYTVLRLGIVAVVLAAMSFSTAQVFAQEDVHMGLARELVLDEKYIIFPVENEAPDKILWLEVDDKKVRELVINLARDKVDFWVFMETKEFADKRATLKTDRLTEEQLDSFFAIRVDSTYPGEDEVYKEKLRPQLHFSSKRGWVNDTNGMMYYDGEYHLFYQHNPYGWSWANMTWGHAVSTDLVHWEEIGDALQIDEHGSMWSGSGVVDWNNTTGFQTGDKPPLITIYTNAGDSGPWSDGKLFTQGIAYSNDRGRT